MPTIIPPIDPALHPVVKAYGPHHQCLDFAASVGTPVVAAHAGRCAVLQPTTAGMTQLMIVSNDRQHTCTAPAGVCRCKCRSLYAPLGAAYVTNGEFVNAGQTIGCTTENQIDGARFRFTLTVDNIPVDPAPLFSEPIARSPYDRQSVAH
jgi:murein DD-endopeptidase MepM/ murein hydrolase activator NlpD